MIVQVTDPTSEDVGAGVGPTFQGGKDAERALKPGAGVVEAKPGIIADSNIAPLSRDEPEFGESYLSFRRPWRLRQIIVRSTHEQHDHERPWHWIQDYWGCEARLWGSDRQRGRHRTRQGGVLRWQTLKMESRHQRPYPMNIAL